MHQLRLPNKKWNYSALAFAVPFVGMLMVMLINGYTPFGLSSAMLYSDMYHQYYPFFVAFRQALRSGDGLIYTWSVGMGMDYVGLISYYLASPLNLLSVLVPEGLLLQYFSLLVPIKLGLAGLFFSLFLKHTFSRDDLSITLFGSFYALCAWALGYQWNVMWLDTFALLPLVVLGMLRLLQERKFLLYTITLFLSVAINYYIGLFACIFILLIFICYEICRWKGMKRFLADLALMAVFSALAIGMTAFLELPTLAALQTTHSSVNRFPTKFVMNIAKKRNILGLLQAMTWVAGNSIGGVVHTFKEGLPNLYCGVLTNFLAVIFVTSPQVKLRDRLCSVFLLLFFNVSFIIRQLDYIWHGFHFPNMIPYRFSFLYSFVLLYMAYRAFLLWRRWKPWQIGVAAVFNILLILANQENTKLVLWAYNVGFVALYTGIFVYAAWKRPLPQESDWADRKRYVQSVQTRKQRSAWMLAGIMVVELIANLCGFGYRFTGTKITNYPAGKRDTWAVVNQMNALEADTLFFRAETTHTQTYNDGALNHYNGITTFTSSANEKTTLFMKALGYGAKGSYNRYSFEEASPVSNLFLDLKYMIERDDRVEENPYFDDVYQRGGVHLLKNNAYLPLGFLANAELADVDFADIDNRFLFQNTLFRAATGAQYNVWDILDHSKLGISSVDVTIDSQSNTGRCDYTSGENGGTIYYRYMADRDGFFCVDLDLSKRNAVTVSLNDTELYSETHSLPQMLSVSQVTAGDVVELAFTCKEDENGTIDVVAAILSEETYRQGYDVLNASTLNLTTFRNTFVEGTIQCDRDGLLYTSIPQNGNWHMQVDGEPVEPVLVGDVMLATHLTQGSHTVTFRYENETLRLGLYISLACLGVLVIISIVYYKKTKYKGKY